MFTDSENRKYADCRIDDSGKKEKLLLYYDGETISGKVRKWNINEHVPWDDLMKFVTQLNFFIVHPEGEKKSQTCT